MKGTLKIIILLSIIPLLIGIFFFSNIKGYYRFKHYCEVEGGLKVYEKLERNVGWLADDYNNAHIAAYLSGVSFVRYRDNDLNFYDLKYITGNPQNKDSYQINPANFNEPVVYKFEFFNRYVENELRLGQSGYQVRSIKDGTVFVRFNMFGYQTTDPRNTPLGPPGVDTCFHEGGATIHDLPRSLAEITTAFKN